MQEDRGLRWWIKIKEFGENRLKAEVMVDGLIFHGITVDGIFALCSLSCANLKDGFCLLPNFKLKPEPENMRVTHRTCLSVFAEGLCEHFQIIEGATYWKDSTNING